MVDIFEFNLKLILFTQFQVIIFHFIYFLQ